MSERTFVMLKPETVQFGNIGEILSRIEKKRLSLSAIKIMKLDRKIAEELYIMHKGKQFFNNLIDYITSGPVIAMIIEGEGAIKKIRRIVGSTDPIEADVGTIRGSYGTSITKNVIHCADSSDNAEREINIFFKRDDILPK